MWNVADDNAGVSTCHERIVTSSEYLMSEIRNVCNLLKEI